MCGNYNIEYSCLELLNLNCGLSYHYVTVMAAELVRAARNEDKGEPQRLRYYLVLLKFIQ